MHWLFLLLLLISGLLIGRDAPTRPLSTCGALCGPAGAIVHGPGYTGVIMPEGAAAEMVSSFFEIEPEIWTPSAAEISQLETDWRVYLATTAHADHPGLDISADGNRQYAGFLEDGQREILVTSFCTMSVTEDIDWRRQPVFVMDGGGCFYHVTYNVATREFSHLLVNGVG